jgi:Protein of unknown function (DUF3047)
LRLNPSVRGVIPVIIGILLLVIEAVLQAAPTTPSILFEEHFTEKQNPDGTPNGWNLKQWSGNNPDIRLVSENGVAALHLISVNNSFGLYKEFKFNVREYPILRWRWKVTVLPKGGDVRRKETDDQAAQIYIPFPRFPAIINTRLVGYIWENKTPKGLKVTSQKSSNTRYIVLENGTEKLGQWIDEERNVYEDYKTLFGEEPPLAGGITLMIDSDDTHSRAESFFDGIRIEKADTAGTKPER